MYSSQNRLTAMIGLTFALSLFGTTAAMAGGTCSYTVPQAGSSWAMLSTPCTGVSVSTLGLPGQYGSEAIVYRRDATSDTYAVLGAGDSLTPGYGYWAWSFAGATLTIAGGPTPSGTCPSGVLPGCFAQPMVGSPDARANMLGLPLETTLEWKDVRVLDSLGNEYDLTSGHVAGVMNRVGYTWNGASYQVFDGQTPGLEGTLNPTDGFFVWSYDTGGAQLLLPTGGAPPPPPPPPPIVAPLNTASKVADSAWHVRLIATSGPLSDPGNVFGQLPSASHGQDDSDLAEMAPDRANYLSLVFPRPEWKRPSMLALNEHSSLLESAWGDAFTSDFHAPRAIDSWTFEVRSATVREVEIRWEGPREIIDRSVLIDLERGEKIAVDVDGAFRFRSDPSGIDRFEWKLRPAKPRAILID